VIDLAALLQQSLADAAKPKKAAKAKPRARPKAA
jgi:hypothetical protein